MAEQDNSQSKNLAPSASIAPVRPPKTGHTFDDSGRPGKRPRLQSPPPMTAAAAHVEARQHQKTPSPSSLQSPNPPAEALAALMGVSQHATSPASQNSRLNPANTMSQPLQTVANNLQGPSDRDQVVDSNSQTSPVTSIGTAASLINPSGSGTAVASPQNMDSGTKSGESVSPQDQSKGSTYPAPSFLTPSATEAGRRGMSLPGSASRQGTRSPSSNKKHKCPYCSTEFTRHHNLKSHLLTHSQEKPYVCSTCNSRFRRLHDLKRHTKLHTGERPHVCPKCNRKFARGDALARHGKGPGGCAGRRASMGSYQGEDDGDDGEGMDGIMYNEPENIDDEESGMRGTPQIRRQPASGDDSIDNSANYRMPSTYPPIQGRPAASFPPPSYPSSTISQPPHQQYSSITSSSKHRQGTQVFAQNPMTESPGPMTPGRQDTMNRNRSPSNPQFAPTYPRGSSGTGSLTVPPHGPQLPPPHGLNPPDPRFTLPSQGGPTHPPTQPSGPPTHMSGSGPLSSHSNSSSHGFSGHGSGEGHKGTFPTNEERLWAVVRSLESQMGAMRETIDALRVEVANLRQAADLQKRP